MKKFSKFPWSVLAIIMACTLLITSALGAPYVDPLDDTDPTEVVAILYRGGSAANTKEFTSIDEALSEAGDSDVLYLVSNATLSGDALLFPGAKFVIPTSSDYTADPDDGNNIKSSVTTSSPYVTLTISSGASLTIYGTMLVAGNQQGAVPHTGYLTGPCGAVDLEGTMIVEDGGHLIARGDVHGGGNVTVNNGGTVTQRLQIDDWRGGHASLNAYDNFIHSVYPFNLYQTGGLDVTATYLYGSTMVAESYIYSDRLQRGTVSSVRMLGSSNALITMSSNATVRFEHNNGVSTAYVNGSVETGRITVYVDSAFGVPVPLTTLGVGPFGYKQNVVLESGANFTVSNRLKVLPGCTITVKSNATLNATGRLFLYTSGVYQPTYNVANWTSTESARVVVEEGGTLLGHIGSTASNFPNVEGLELSSDSTEAVWEVTQTDTDVDFKEVSFYVVNLA